MKMQENVMMSEEKSISKYKGGRPKQAVKRSQQLAVMCTMLERKIIEHKARTSGMCLSEYLRTLALNRQADRKIKALPKEILLFTATLNHMAANLNQIARKRNSFDELNALERITLQQLSEEVKQLAVDIKKYLQ